MIRYRPGDVNKKCQITFNDDVWIQPDGIVMTRNQGELTSPRWYYRDNPINGIGEKENLAKLTAWDNTSPWETL